MTSCQSNDYTTKFYLAGGIISLLAEAFVIFSFHKFKATRRHPSSLVYWQSQMDFFFSLQFGVGYFMETCHDCDFFSFTFQLFICGSLAWYAMLSVDLIAATRNPFSEPKSNVPKYHLFSWGTALLSATIVVVTGRAKYRQDLSVCWIEKTTNGLDINWVTWICFWIPMFSTITVSIDAYSLASYRLSRGLSQTLNFRKSYLRRVRIYVLVFMFYWMIAGSLYIAIYFISDNTNAAYKVFAFVVAARGVFVAGAWTLNEGVVDAYRRWIKGEQPPELMEFNSINHALRMEVLQYSTEAIKLSVLHAQESKTSATNPAQLDELAYMARYEFCVSLEGFPTKPPFCDYAPDVFRVVRLQMGISDADYIKSIKGDKNAMVERFTEGRSGSFFYFSEDGRYLVKTLSSSEAQFFKKILKQYVEYQFKNKDTLITKFLGLHNIKLYNKSVDFVVMQSVFQTKLKIADRYDLKGSSVDRNRTDGTGVFKDNDLQFKIHLDPTHRAKFLAQCKQDVAFLAGLSIMDYSLLLGSHNICYMLTERYAAGETDDAKVPFYQTDSGGMRAQVIEGPGIFFFGIIDILQEYNAGKKLERWFKTAILRKDPNGISAIPCEPYARRFVEKMTNITTETIPTSASSFQLTREAAITVDNTNSPVQVTEEKRLAATLQYSPSNAKLKTGSCSLDADSRTLSSSASCRVTVQTQLGETLKLPQSSMGTFEIDSSGSTL